MRRVSPRCFWLVVAITAAAVLLPPPGLYAWHLMHQRSLQAQLNALQGVSCDGNEQIWLHDWLPERFSHLLPPTSLEVGTDAEESLDDMALVIQQMVGVRRLGLYGISHFGERGWTVVSSQRRLQSLELINTSTSDYQIAELGQHQQLRNVSIQEAPITNASLETLVKLSELKDLLLFDTHVTLSGIQAFAEARPDVSISWQPLLTEEQKQNVAALQQRGCNAFFAHPYGRIATIPEWNVVVDQGLILDSDLMTRLQQLGGQITGVSVKGDCAPEVLNLIYNLPSVRDVRFFEGSATTADIDSIARLNSIQSVRYEDRLFGNAEQTALYEQWGNKVPEPRHSRLRCD